MRRLVLLTLAATLHVAVPAAASSSYEAERLRVVRGKAAVVRDAGAGGGRALRLRRAAALELRVEDGPLRAVKVRARARPCGRRLVLRVRVGSRAVRLRIRSGAWRDHTMRVSAPAGTHTIRVAYDGARARAGCRPHVDVDRLSPESAIAPPALEPRPAPTPTPAPPPPPPNDPPPPEPLLPPSPVSPLVPDPARSGPVPLGAALFLSHLASDPDYETAFLREFDALTPENEMKMERLQPQRGVFAFAEADAVVDFAAEHGRPVHGHTLVWHGQLPYWVTNGQWTAEELTEVMRVHIQTVMVRYKGRVREWDVVNEPFNPDGSYRDNIWHRVIGPGYIERALRFAREADPDARLYINEIGAETPNAQSDALFHLAETYKLLSVPLDGVGFQNHTNHNGYPRRDALLENFRRFASLGLEIQVTEMDVAAKGGPETLEQRLTAQSAAYRDAAEACWLVAACKRFTVWGVSDRYSWIGADEIPLLLDSAYARKPAMAVVREALDG